jgi:polymorphic toxin system DSP-PTPase phosphatase-like protein
MSKCVGHKQAVVVCKAPVRILAGGKSPGTPIPLGSTILSLGVNLESPVQGLPALESRVVRVDWPDMSTPAIDAEGWKRIARALAALRKPIYVSCNAGHGRTGTCLAILAHFLGQMPKKMDPVEWVRAHYCPSAVETKGQVEYIAEITGRETKAHGSNGGGTVTHTVSSTGGYKAQTSPYEEGMVWDSKTNSWVQKQTKYDFSKGPSYYCKGMGDKCTSRVTIKGGFCTKCQEKEGVTPEGEPVGAKPPVEPRASFPEMPKTGKPDMTKYFPGNGK